MKMSKIEKLKYIFSLQEKIDKALELRTTKRIPLIEDTLLETKEFLEKLELEIQEELNNNK